MQSHWYYVLHFVLQHHRHHQHLQTPTAKVSVMHPVMVVQHYLALDQIRYIVRPE
jgi:hypothetical protein